MNISSVVSKYNFSPNTEKLYDFFEKQGSVFAGTLVPSICELKNIGRLIIDSAGELSELCAREKEEYFFLREKAFVWLKKIDESEFILKSPGIEIAGLINLVQTFFDRISNKRISIETALKVAGLIEDEVEFDSFIKILPFEARSEILKNVVNFAHYQKNINDYYLENLSFSFVEKITLEDFDFLEDAQKCHNLTYLKLDLKEEVFDEYNDYEKLKKLELNFPSVEEMESDLCTITKKSNFSSLSKLTINVFNENAVIEKDVYLPQLSDVNFNAEDCEDKTVSSKLLNLPLHNISKLSFIGCMMDPAVFREAKHLESLKLDVLAYKIGEEFVGNTLSYLSIRGEYTIADRIEFPELKSLCVTASSESVTASSEEGNVFLRSKLNAPALENLELIAEDEGFLHKEFDLSKIKVLKLSYHYSWELPDTFRDIEAIYVGNYLNSFPESTKNLDHPLTIHRTIREEGGPWEQKKKELAKTVEVIHPHVTGKRSTLDFLETPAKKRSCLYRA